MANFNFDHSTNTYRNIGQSIGLSSAKTIEIKIRKWIQTATNKNKTISFVMEQIKNHKSFSKDEKLFAFFALGCEIMKMTIHDTPVGVDEMLQYMANRN